jgi:hypothetical protein
MGLPVKKLARAMRSVFDCTKITMTPIITLFPLLPKLAAAGKSLPLGGIPPHHKPEPLPNVPAAIIFSPHPDDECIAGGQGGKQISATENPGSRLDLIH